MDFLEIIKKHQISRKVLAGRMKMSYSTFTNKLGTSPIYRFTDRERQQLAEILREIGTELIHFSNTFKQ